MFGSKQLLIAFIIGAIGQALIMTGLIDTLPPAKLIVVMLGMLAIWVSALFGPLFVMQERGVTTFTDDTGPA